jgi:RNase P subunit RPR2
MAEQMIRMMCPNLTCRKVLSVPEVARGKTVRCKQCGTNIRVPEAKKPDSSASKS